MALILIIPDDRGKTLASFFFKDFIYLFLESWEGREKERERNINVWLPLPYSLLESWPATQTCALTGNWTSDPLVHRPAFSPLSHTSQGGSKISKACSCLGVLLVDVQLPQNYLLKRICFIVLLLLLCQRLLTMLHGSISGLFFHWSTCWFFCQYHTLSIPVWL